MNRLRACFLLPLTSLLAASCGDDEPDKYATRDGFCDQWALQACNITIIEECADDKADCQAGQREYCRELVPAGKYNKAGGKKCAEAIGKTLVKGELTPAGIELYRDLGGDCSEVVSGKREKGETCSDDSDCATKDGLRCIIKAGELSGKCHEPNLVSGGDDCDGEADVCPDTHFCDVDVCRTLRGLDDECSLALPCDAETMCVNEEEGRLVEGDEMGVCVERFGNQDACLLDQECLSNICSPSQVCLNKIDIRGDSTFNSCADFHN